MPPRKVLLDTSVIVDFLRKKDKEKTILYTLARKGYGLNVSLITHTELYAGKSVWEKTKARRELETIFEGLEVLELNEKISKEAGKIRAKCNLDLIDAIIAATALYYKLPLVTLNVRDFKKTRGLKIVSPDELASPTHYNPKG